MKKKLNEFGIQLLNAGVTIGTVEHCTSGLLGAAISSVCGISTIYKGTIVAVDSEHMEKLLDVSPNILKKNGLISSQVACQLALGGLYKLDADICVSIVGNVVPPISAEDDSDNTVWICVATMTDKKVDFKYVRIEANGLRGENIEAVVKEALDCVIEEIKKSEIK